MIKIKKGENDLFTTNPELKNEWDFSRNVLDPYTLSKGMLIKVWWHCEKNHVFEASISNYVSKKTGCPYCSGKLPIKGENDLETLYPEIAKEWDYIKNVNSFPSDFRSNSTYNAWWLCKEGHSYQTTINKRVLRKHGCPYCSGHRVLDGFNDLFSTNPELINQWDYTKNLINPKNISRGSSIKVWWLCKEGHSYLSSPLNRINGKHGCPYCSNSSVLTGINDLLTLYPEIAKEWHPTKNMNLQPQDVFSRSGKKVWWLCKYGHEWEQSPHLRTAGRGCPICSNEIHVSFPEKAIYYYLKKSFNNVLANYNPGWNYQGNIDIYLPEFSLGIEYDGKRWHQDVQRDLMKNKMCEHNNIKLIRIREKGCKTLNDGVEFYISRDDLVNAITLVFEYINNQFNLCETPNIDLINDRTEINELVISSEKNKNITVTHPSIAEEWNYEKNGYLKPEYVTYGSTKKVWWKCNKGHEWIASINNRCGKNRGCPICANVKIVDGVNDLKTLYPYIANEFDIVKNYPLVPNKIGSRITKKVWWRCNKCGFEWEAPVSWRTKGHGCPNCKSKMR